MKTRILTPSKEIDTNRAARNRHSQYQFPTAGEQFASSVIATHQQIAPMYVNLTRSFAYWRAAGGTAENEGGRITPQIRAGGPLGDDPSNDDPDGCQGICPCH